MYQVTEIVAMFAKETIHSDQTAPPEQLVVFQAAEENVPRRIEQERLLLFVCASVAQRLMSAVRLITPQVNVPSPNDTF